MRKWQLAWLLVAALLLVVTAGCAGDDAAEQGTPSTKTESEAGAGLDYAVEVTAEQESITLGEGQTDADIAFTVTNMGDKPDTYALVTRAFGAVWEGAGIPTSTTLDPGDSEVIVIPMTFEAQGSVAGGIDISLTATSEGDPEIADEAVCNVDL